MLQVFHHANFRIMYRTKWICLAFSAITMTLAIGTMIVKGFNYGIDFAGGTAVQVRFVEEPDIERLRTSLDGAGLGDVTIQRIGDPADHEVLIRVEREAHVAEGDEGGQVSAKVVDAIRKLEGVPASEGKIDLNAASRPTLSAWVAAHLPAPAAGAAAPDSDRIAGAILDARQARGGMFTDMAQVTGAPGVDPSIAAALSDQAVLNRFALRGVDFVGPTAGRELMRNTLWAILASVFFILLYVWFRFHRVAWGATSVIALVHDVTIAAGAMAFTGKEFSLTVVAALLAIVGYSINDTIVVFDRIRENLRLYRDHDFERVVNASVNQTLSRTILTSFTVFIAVVALLMFGGEKLNPMSFCLVVGIGFGTYSSVWVASALLVVAHQLFGARHIKS
jgi:preprotein translocase subunit SecF